MKMSDGVEWALHCCTVLSAAEQPVPASRLAEYHDVSPTYLAKHLQALSRAGLVQSSLGKSGGYALTRAPEDISVLEVVEAVDGQQSAFVCTEIRQRGPRASPPEDCRTPCGINRVMLAADAAWRASLADVSIADLGNAFGPVGMRGVQHWLASR